MPPERAPAMSAAPAFIALPWYRSLRFKLVLTAVIVEVSMLGLLLANSYRLLGEALETQTQGRLEALKPLMNAALAGRVFQRDHSEVQAILDQLVERRLANIRYLLVTDPSGQPIAHAGDMTPAAALQIQQDSQALQCLDDLTFDTQTPLTLSGNHTVGTVRFGLSLLPLTDLRDRILQQSLLIAAVAVALSLLLLAALGYLLTRHLSTLLAAARRIASADFSQPIEIASRDEIGLLANDFNTMQHELRERIVALAESEGRFRTIFDAAGDAFFIHDGATGQLLDVNRRMCEMYGCTRDDALSATPETFSANVAPYNRDHALEKLRLTRETGMQTFDWQARRLDGELFWVEVNLRHVWIGGQERIVALVRDISDRMQHQQKLEFLAHHDPLTQLPNRLLFSDRLQQATAQTRRNQRLLAIAMLDLDGFKPVNDTLGHEIGDKLLIQVAQRLRESTRAGDTVARLGGDEFALLINELETVEEGGQTFRRVLESIGQSFRTDEHSLNITASIGVTFYPFDDVDSDTLIRHADQAMYVAKQHGRNRFHIFDAERDRQVQAHRESHTRVAYSASESSASE